MGRHFRVKGTHTIEELREAIEGGSISFSLGEVDITFETDDNITPEITLHFDDLRVQNILLIEEDAVEAIKALNGMVYGTRS